MPMYIDKNKILSDITKEDFIKILEAIGITQYKVENNEIILSTEWCHGGDSNKLYWYPKSKSNEHISMFKCYTCSDTYGLESFIIRCFRHMNKSMTYYKALSFIGTVLGRLEGATVESPEKIKKPNDDFTWINRIKAVTNREGNIPHETKEINENVLELFTYIPHEAWLNDGCSVEALDRFEIGYYPPQNAISIPHRDQDGKLIGIRCRNLDPMLIETAGKYLPLHINGEWLKHSLGEHLYGLWVTKDYIKQCGKIMIVEAEKSCLQAFTMFSDKSYVAATCGSSIGPVQFDIIRSLGVSKLIYAPDRDYHASDTFEAEAWFNKQILKLAPFLLYCQVYLIADTKDRLGYKDSPTDKGRDIFLELYEEKIEITSEMVREVKEGKKNERDREIKEEN